MLNLNDISNGVLYRRKSKNETRAASNAVITYCNMFYTHSVVSAALYAAAQSSILPVHSKAARMLYYKQYMDTILIQQ